ncbi:MAG: ABC transporter permease subunit [Candidatus Aminicenantes bacterium]|nr:ABC transporter permease subunit [Candidatus Aminicenantes bacterium]NIM85079.1 ABC transporter permease subunit [Candidatus Aminicenantes bacterium]NIN24586.1 ABC transporter permease subunit [Candidatus Aminicenantes bacterium]NIN48350.1 ABC transporter permease subunit [Candidatus Aminicenantes bacterium]NIN91253.1 ABC transporter permease subunit [Candidatus Aminicenantes bacterium]
MKKYIYKRTLLLLFLLIAVSTVVFFLIHFIPGDPVVGILGEGASIEDINRLKQDLNLDKPLLFQYLDFSKNLFNLSFGKSLFNQQTVIRNILTVLPNTLYLALASMVLALIISFPLGTWAAIKGDTHTVVDTSVTLVSSVGLAIPNFVLGPLLIIIFSIKLGWFPVSGSQGFACIILPALTLGTSMSAFLTRIIRTSIGTELKKPYVLLARAKGLTGFQIFKKHLLKNALIPIVTIIGLQMGALLTGAIITETIFSWHGIGSLLVTAIKQRDYPMVQGIIVFMTFVYLILSFLVDLSYFLIDPRIRHQYQYQHHQHNQYQI